MKVLDIALASVAALAVTGCSQIGGLAPVGGDQITALRTAVYDVLLESNVPILVAPTCVEDDDTFRCTGSTEDGTSITAIAPVAKPLVMSVSVGDTVLYEGDVHAVIERLAEVPQ